MGSPQDYPSEMPSNANQRIPSRNDSFKVYNNQTINNQYSKLPFKVPGQLSNISDLNPIPFNIPITPTLSPDIRNVQSHPIFITPNPISPQPILSNTIDNYDYVPVANTSVPLTNRFKSLDQIKKNLNRKTQFETGNIFGVRKKQYRNRFHNWSNKQDLRLLLSSKKRKPESSNILSEDKSNNFHLISCDDNDEIWLETNLRTPRFHALLDISALKKLLRVENNFKVWYIVVDSNVLLRNINFLNILLNSDSQCCLMVPHIVMDEIQMATNSCLRTKAHRAAYFISQQVDANIAAIEEPNLEYNDNRDALMNCCAKLVNQGYEVVLLTDDVELHNLENTSSFLIFTVRQMKKILLKTNSCGSISNNSEELALKQKRNIKVTIPNDVNKKCFDHIQQNTDETDTILSHDACIDENSIPKDDPIQLTVEDSVQSNQIQKNTDDVAVQANSFELNAIHENNDRNVDTFSSSNNLKAKRIRLKRTLSNDINSSNNNRSKTWYKRRSQKSFTSSWCNSNVSENIQIDIDTMTEKSCQPNCQNSCGVSSLESIESFHHYSNHESSESSNVEARKNCRKGYIIDEKFASAKSNIHNMENDQSISKRSTEDQFCSESCDNGDENVMFEVTSKAMEDILKMKCDEWISRFVQIIEEVSTQVLQQDPPFILDTMLPPWTIYEATECIKRKFSYDNDTVDAANKLLNVLFEIGGLRGKIKIDINPNKYMEMYSYGVYLIDALQGLISNSEDLQIAAESLSKLLSDIQDSHLNPGNQDSFSDDHIHNQDTAVNISETKDQTCNDAEITDNVISDKDESVQTNESENIQKVSTTSPVRSTSRESRAGKYNSRSHRNKFLQEKRELPEKITFTRNNDVKSSFFKSLHLKNTFEINKDIETKATASANQDFNIEDRKDANSECNLEIVKETNEKIDSTSYKKDIFTNKAKIIINFVKFPVFEDKINNKSNLVYDSWTNKNDKNRSELECTENEQNDYEFLEDGYYCDNDYDYDYEFETIDAEEVSGENLDNDEEERHVNTGVEIHNINFKAIIQKIQHNIKETFSSVHGFCEKCYSTLSSDSGYFKKNDIQHLAKKTHSYLKDLCDALTSVLTRETSKSIHKMQELLKFEEFKDIIVEDGDLEGYRHFITQCIEQGSILKDSVKLIIEATRE
ncbi:uncharacterized protein LOC126772619 [Nymphalis io]|uniref:uncharacterized protein LOC126772619 n=1 Tax=Inachis io TaxID=171585 RepID=UPI0021691A42|nr:uncharacterized protein LOC126772619 [Nymphalis io]XP_050348960.1 uncharacterized protein LOC126772619 [Nymphalis io]